MNIEQIERRQLERIAEFAKHGVKAIRAESIAGWITLSATEAEKVLRLLRQAQAGAEGE